MKCIEFIVAHFRKSVVNNFQFLRQNTGHDFQILGRTFDARDLHRLHAEFFKVCSQGLQESIAQPVANALAAQG